MKRDVTISHTPITWRAHEFLYQKKSLFWYTNVWIGFIVMALLLVLFGSWFGLLIALALFIIFLLRANDRPRTIDYAIDATGITVGERRLSYSDIDSYSLDITHKTPIVICDLKQPLTMPITLLVKDDHLDDVSSILMRHVPFNNRFSLIRWVTHLLHY